MAPAVQVPQMGEMAQMPQPQAFYPMGQPQVIVPSRIVDPWMSCIFFGVASWKVGQIFCIFILEMLRLDFLFSDEIPFVERVFLE